MQCYNIYFIDLIQKNELGDNAKASDRDRRSEDAAKYLFLWAVLFNRRELAELLWKYTSDHVGEKLINF